MDRMSHAGITLIFCISLVMFSSGMVIDNHAWSNNIQVSGNPWLVANGVDNCVLTLEIGNYTNATMDGYLVEFSVNNSVFGSLNPVSSYTVNNKTSTTFTTKTKSGTALITGKVFYKINDADPNEEFKNRSFDYTIYIDHDTPYLIPAGGVILPSGGEATVGSNVTVGVQMKDAHGNVVDNRREKMDPPIRDAEKVRFSITGSPSGTGYFSPERVENIDIQVNETGWAVTTYRMDERPGPNILKFEPLTSVPDIKRTIMGLANGIPCYLNSTIYPFEYVPADGESFFSILYTVQDEFHNGLQVTALAINTTLGENYVFYTNSTGQIGMKYGPKSEIGEVLITATTPGNSTLIVSDLVRFVNLTANQMIFTATPQSMASYDARPGVSTLYAYVLDQEGNPVAGERVKFTIVDKWCDKPATCNVTEQPSLQNGTINLVDSVWETTDEQGLAKVYLKPVSFNVDENAPPYDPAATSHCIVHADWTDINGTHVIRPLTFTFKNYPYLSAVTSVSKTRVNVTDTVDVTLTLKGDGFMLIPKPIDVMMVVDRSGSMDESDMEDGMKRITALINAASNFVDEINISAEYTTNRVGLLPYSSDIYWYRYRDLTTNYGAIKYQISKLTPSGYTGSRFALKTAIDKMNAFPNSDPRTIRAIVFMTDGDFNYYGDPLARGYGFNSANPGNSSYGNTYYRWTNTYIDRHTVFSGLDGQTKVWNSNVNTNQNMSNYAKNNNLKIYTISFSSDVNRTSDTWMVMENLANATGGKHFHANSAAELNDVYAQIAGELRTKAGVNTTSYLDFQNITVKNATVAGAEAFEYVYDDGQSTFWKKYKTGSETTPYLSGTIDDTTNWTTNHALNFDVGNIEVNDNWQVTFRLRVLTDGDIHVFGNNSLITFDDQTKSLHIPDTVITAIPNLVNESFTYGEFSETGINVTQISDTVYKWTWSRYYTGDYDLQEFYYISLDGGYQWTLVGQDELSPNDVKEHPIGFFQYDIQNLLPYGALLEDLTIDFKVKAYALDAPSPQSPRGPGITRHHGFNQSYITLK